MYNFAGEYLYFDKIERIKGRRVLRFCPHIGTPRPSFCTIFPDLSYILTISFENHAGKYHPLELPGVIPERYFMGIVAVRLELNSGQYCTYRVENGDWVF